MIHESENRRIRLNLPEGDLSQLQEATEAIKIEYQASARWMKLRCRSVIPLPSAEGENIFILEVGPNIEFEWTWEGSKAFTTIDPDSFSGRDADESLAAWSGEVVEVDELKGHVFVWANGSRPPTIGWFFIRPFAFLAGLHAIYADSDCESLQKRLPERLNACLGEIHPRANPGPMEGLPENWQYSWGVMWGPPGTGKTFQIGQQIASCLNDASERILVVSTTNKATDTVALSIGKAVHANHDNLLQEGRILRVGKGVRLDVYERADMTRLLAVGASSHLLGVVKADLIRERDEQKVALNAARTPIEKAQINQKIKLIERQLADEAYVILTSSEFKVVVATAHKALSLITSPAIVSDIDSGVAPFTTVIIDEAGLISRIASAALSLLASRRVLLVGDSKQLAPISKVSRLLASSKSRWLASSSLIHLQSLTRVTNPAVNLLTTQYRMHPEVSQVVSSYQYENLLIDAKDLELRPFSRPHLLNHQPRCIWYVLDDDADKLASIRGERGPGNRSWVRKITENVLSKLSSDQSLKSIHGLFLAPFKAQVESVARILAAQKWDGWTAATIHSQQGAEAEIVIFDTVNAGCQAWSEEEWQRMVNVGLSRAREFVLFLASRAEMQQPFLAPLIKLMAPKILIGDGKWKELAITEWVVPPGILSDPNSLGHQIATRRQLRPILSAEQQRLSERKMDGKPRLVRGVAGSGKTVILARWLSTVLAQFDANSEAKIMVVFGNLSLAPLIQKFVEEACQHLSPGELQKKVQYWHIKYLIDHLLSLARISFKYDLDYDRAAERLLQKCSYWEAMVGSVSCDAMFIDEGQDMGANTFKLLTKLVRQDSIDEGGPCLNIFYDNAQNIYGQSTPKWKEIGLDMHGRSTIMKESFRSTKPITEFALNVLCQLQPPKDDDHRELVRLRLITPEEWENSVWWNVNFNQVDGPVPVFRPCSSVNDEVRKIAKLLKSWIKDEGVTPSDICILYVGNAMQKELESVLGPELKALNATLAMQRGERFTNDPGAVVATTPHSFKGYERELVIIAGVEEFAKRGENESEHAKWARTLYVAMTRARSLLVVFGWNKSKAEVQNLFSLLKRCLLRLANPPPIQQLPDEDEPIPDADD